FQITTVPGIKNMVFGGDGIFLASLTGPGRIWLQTLPISKLAHKLMEYMPRQHKEAVEGGVVGGIVGSILDGMKLEGREPAGACARHVRCSARLRHHGGFAVRIL